MAGDRVMYGDQECEVQFVADPLVDPNVNKFGAGAMITAYGGLFLRERDEDLVFISRKQEKGL